MSKVGLETFLTREETGHLLMHCDQNKINGRQSVLTVMGGRVVYGGEEFGRIGPAPLPISRDWSPVEGFGGYGAPHYIAAAAASLRVHSCCGHTASGSQGRASSYRSIASRLGDWLAGHRHEWDPGCSCLAF